MSLGPYVPVPALVGQTEAQAASLLSGASLQGAKTTAWSTTVAKDLVISQAPAATTVVARDSTVGYVVSLGPSSTVPALVGQTEAQAASLLSGASLQGAKTTAWSTTVAKDVVISQDPAATTVVARDSTVGYVVSLGPSSTVPALVGQTEAQAASLLSGASLQGAKTTAWSTTVAKDVVISQVPPRPRSWPATRPSATS